MRILPYFTSPLRLAMTVQEALAHPCQDINVHGLFSVRKMSDIAKGIYAQDVLHVPDAKRPPREAASRNTISFRRPRSLG
jgi:hypothetical protein